MKTKQAVNPYMPSWEYVPDAEPHVVDGRVYVYGSHDLFNGINFCLGDYVCWSAPVDDLGNWRYEGEIFKRSQDPAAPRIRVTNGLAAPDMVQGPDGRFYLYYFMGGTKMISVAVCDKPAGKYEFYGYVHYSDDVPIGKKDEPFQFDPGIFMDDDGRLYLYTGFALEGNPILLDGSKPTEHGAMCFEIDTTDMLTVLFGPDYIGIASKKEAPGTPYEGHPFLEASSMRKFNGTYYFIYSSLNSHELCYATSDNPTSGFQYGGILISNGDIGLPGVTDVNNAKNYTGNTHGSLIEINGKYYIFYHRHTNRKQSSRQGCAEEIRFEDGKFYQAEMTSCGLNGGPLEGKGNYPTAIACNLYGPKGTKFLSMIKHPKKGYPYITQDGGDRNEGPEQYVANMCDGAVAGFKYFDLSNTKKIHINIKSKATGIVYIRTQENGSPVAQIAVKPSRSLHGFSTDLKGLGKKEALFFKFEGKGAFDFISFDLK
ncbi:MAG: family 43 glycosylhydrolase [Clostridiales bacterium]|nr:family 43 glycosylhydrolase [Clostridiales bacterium]